MAMKNPFTSLDLGCTAPVISRTSSPNAHLTWGGARACPSKRARFKGGDLSGWDVWESAGKFINGMH